MISSPVSVSRVCASRSPKLACFFLSINEQRKK
jgi:hypothetical protein